MAPQAGGSQFCICLCSRMKNFLLLLQLTSHESQQHKCPWNPDCRCMCRSSHIQVVLRRPQGATYLCFKSGFPFVLISCSGGPSALFSFSLQAAPSSGLYPLRRLRERTVFSQGDSQRTHTRFHVVLMCKVELMGLLSFRQLVHLSKDGLYRSTSLPLEFGNAATAQ